MNSETTPPSAPLHAFVMHLEQQPGIDPKHTNHELIAALFSCWELREQYGIHGRVTCHECGRGEGVTRTLIEWAKWIDEPVLAIAQHREPWKHAGIDSRSWLASIRGIHPRPKIVLIDAPANRDVFESVVMSAKFEDWLSQFSYTAFYADQRAVQCA